MRHFIKAAYLLKVRKLVTTRVHTMCLNKRDVNFSKFLSDMSVINHYAIHNSGKMCN